MLSIDNLDGILAKSSEDAWEYIQNYIWNIFSEPLDLDSVDKEILSRDSKTNGIEEVLATSCYDLWYDFERCVNKTSDQVKLFWNGNYDGKLVLILDGLSMREIPYLLEGLKSRNYVIEKQCITGSELPSDTNSFAKAIGISHRGALTNNGVSKKSIFSNGYTDCIGLSWERSKDIIKSQKNLFIWHKYPDEKMHDLNSHGTGMQDLFISTKDLFLDEAFWSFIQKISTGRDVVITSDHGYAATGLYMDITDKDQKDYLKKRYKSSRFTKNCEIESHWIPPIEMKIDSKIGEHTFVLGKKKWKTSGGYPILTHGGLSLLEVMVPFIHFRQEGK